MEIENVSSSTLKLKSSPIPISFIPFDQNEDFVFLAEENIQILSYSNKSIAKNVFYVTLTK